MSRLIFNSPFMLGFDYIEQALEKSKGEDSYPPYNIEKHEDILVIKLCVAGFIEEDLNITQENNQLIISGCKYSKPEEEEIIYLHKGISFRKFQKSFILAEGIEPIKSYLKNGILTVELKKQIIQKEVKIINITSK